MNEEKYYSNPRVEMSARDYADDYDWRDDYDDNEQDDGEADEDE